MIDERKWLSLMQSAENATALCFASCDRYLLGDACRRTLSWLQKAWSDSEVTRFAPEEIAMEPLISAAGTISFFSTRRIIYLTDFPVTSLDEAFLKDFGELLASTENAFFLISCCFKDEREKKNKKAKLLEDSVRLNGYYQELATPRPGDMRVFAQEKAAELSCRITSQAAGELADRVGTDLQLLSCEMEKLAAGAGYGEITSDTVSALAVQSVEATTFQIADAVTAGRPARAFAILNKLLYLRVEPILISAALSSSFADMARVKTASAQGIGYSTVFRELKYTGNDYRLKCASAAAARYQPGQLLRSLDILGKLDADIKSSPVDTTVLLQTTVSELCAVARRG